MINVRICTLKGKRVIAGQCREGLYALPKTMFDRLSKAVVTFQIGGGVFSKRLCFSIAVGSFFVGGHEALPCTGYMYDPCVNMYVEDKKR
jgi:hypothetical protein